MFKFYPDHTINCMKANCHLNNVTFCNPQTVLCSAEALVKENWGKKRTRKIREEKEASDRCHTQDSRYPGVDFFNFQPARLGSLRSNFSHPLFLTAVVTVGPVWLT